jgi:DMSO/TMAO reductase YedYZ heme-binding membrane subunit
MLRGRMARSATATRRWRYLHASAYLAWAASAWHFLQAGSDSSTWWALSILVAGVLVVAGGAIGRVLFVATSASQPAAATLVRGRAPNHDLVGASR